MTWRSWPEITNSSVFFVATCGISKLVCWNALWKARIYLRSSHNLWSPVCSLKLCHHFSTFESSLSVHWTHITLQQTTSFSAVSHFILLIFVFVWGFLMLQQWFHTVCQLAAQRSLELTQRLLEVGTCWDTVARKKLSCFPRNLRRPVGKKRRKRHFRSCWIVGSWISLLIFTSSLVSSVSSSFPLVFLTKTPNFHDLQSPPQCETHSYSPWFWKVVTSCHVPFWVLSRSWVNYDETQHAHPSLDHFYAIPGGGVALQLGLTQLMGQASQRAAEQLQLGHWKLQRLMDAVKASPVGKYMEHIWKIWGSTLVGEAQIISRDILVQFPYFQACWVKFPWYLQLNLHFWLVKHHCWWLNSSFLLGFRRLDPQNLQRPGSWKWPQHPRALKPRGKNPAPGAWEALRPSPGGWGDGRNFQGKIWENDGKMLLFAVFFGMGTVFGLNLGFPWIPEWFARGNHHSYSSEGYGLIFLQNQFFTFSKSSFL